MAQRRKVTRKGATQERRPASRSCTLAEVVDLLRALGIVTHYNEPQARAALEAQAKGEPIAALDAAQVEA